MYFSKIRGLSYYTILFTYHTGTYFKLRDLLFETIRDSLRASQSEILTKHKNPNSFKEFCLFYFPKKHKQVWFFWEIKNPQQTLWVSFCGERGIRTPGPVTVNSFQDCRIRPLCHFSRSLIRYSLNADANIESFFIF